MKVDIPQLLTVFDQLLDVTDEELGVYWLEAKRPDNYSTTITFSIYEDYTGIIVCDSSDTGLVDVSMKNCSEIRVLDEKKRCLEIVHDNGNGRCFLALDGDSIVQYTE